MGPTIGHVLVTMFACPTWRTFALVLLVAQIQTGGSVFAQTICATGFVVVVVVVVLARII